MRILFLLVSSVQCACLFKFTRLPASILPIRKSAEELLIFLLGMNIEAIPLKVKISSQMRSKTTVFCLGKECGAGGGSIDKSHVGEIIRELYTSLRLSWRLTGAKAYSSLIPFPLCDQGLLGFEF